MQFCQFLFTNHPELIQLLYQVPVATFLTTPVTFMILYPIQFNLFDTVSQEELNCVIIHPVTPWELFCKIISLKKHINELRIHEYRIVIWIITVWILLNIVFILRFELNYVPSTPLMFGCLQWNYYIYL